MNWKPITNLPANWKTLVNLELPPLVTVWEEQADRLRNSGEFLRFMERLSREIAIETGIIERLYNIDRGITQLLIQHGINEALIPYGATDRPVEQVIALIRDQQTAIEGLFNFVGRQRSLSNSYIKQLHQVLTQSQDSIEALIPSTQEITKIPFIGGNWKMYPNNPTRPDGLIHEYCPPEQVASEMDQLITWYHEHEVQNIAPEVEAAWLHHRFTQIHPFQDGNGRVARCLASLIFIQAKWFPLVLTRDDRSSYIEALEIADQGDLSGLVNLFAKSQKLSFIRSLGLSEQILSEGRRTKAIIEVAFTKLKQKQLALEKQYKKVENYAQVLAEIAFNRLQDIIVEIKSFNQNLSDDNRAVFIIQANPDDPRSSYHYYQVIETAKQLGYFANVIGYHSWIQLVINIGVPTIILISFHILGHEYRGVLVASACAYHRYGIDNGEQNIGDIQTLSDTPFQFSYADLSDNLVMRFRTWLDQIIVTGLEYWNQSI